MNHETSRRSLRLVRPAILITAALLGLALLGHGLYGSATAPQGLSPAQKSPRYRPIEQVQVGQYVVAHNPQMTEEERDAAEAVDPPNWRKITLRMTKEDGSKLDIVLLRPACWVELEEATPGGEIELDLAELGAVGLGEVLAVEPCPPITPNPQGRLVTGTFAHQSAHVVDLYVEGQEAPIGVTASHPFWSKDCQDFVPAGKLRVGERLSSLTGEPKVTAIVPRNKVEQVYNLEVDVEHVYLVTHTGLVVHNTYYQNVFFKVFPKLRGKVWVHHSVPQAVLKKYEGLFTRAEIDSIDFLRGIPNKLNAKVHLSQINTLWKNFYKQYPTAGKQEILDFAKAIDEKFINIFIRI